MIYNIPLRIQYKNISFFFNTVIITQITDRTVIQIHKKEPLPLSGLVVHKRSAQCDHPFIAGLDRILHMRRGHRDPAFRFHRRLIPVQRLDIHIPCQLVVPLVDDISSVLRHSRHIINIVPAFHDRLKLGQDPFFFRLPFRFRLVLVKQIPRHVAAFCDDRGDIFHIFNISIDVIVDLLDDLTHIIDRIFVDRPARITHRDHHENQHGKYHQRRK